MTVGMSAPDAFKVAREFATRSLVVDRAVQAKVRFWGRMLATRVRANATTGHHRPGAPHIPGTGPGPNVATGDYRRSINLEFADIPGGHYAYVGTNAPQGRRLELGFVGPDALGRVYNDPPRPHFGTALDWVDPLFTASLAEVADLDKHL